MYWLKNNIDLEELEKHESAEKKFTTGERAQIVLLQCVTQKMQYKLQLNRPKSGRKRITSASQDRMLARTSLQNGKGVKESSLEDARRQDERHF